MTKHKSKAEKLHQKINRKIWLSQHKKKLWLGAASLVGALVFSFSLVYLVVYTIDLVFN